MIKLDRLAIDQTHTFQIAGRRCDVIPRYLVDDFGDINEQCREVNIHVWLEGLENENRILKEIEQDMDSNFTYTAEEGLIFRRKREYMGQYSLKTTYVRQNLNVADEIQISIPILKYEVTSYCGAYDCEGHREWLDDGTKPGQIIILRDSKGQTREYQYVPGFFKGDEVNRPLKAGEEIISFRPIRSNYLQFNMSTMQDINLSKK